QAEAHGAETAGGEQVAGVEEGPGMGDPHLVQADVGGDDGVVRQKRGEVAAEVDRMQRVLGGGRVGEGVLGAQGGGAREPVGVRLRGQAVEQAAQDVGGVAGEAEEGLLDLADLGGVDVDVGDGGARAEFGDLAGGAIVEARADGEDEVGLFEEVVGAAGGVHAEHAHVERVVVGQGAESHGRGDGGRVEAMGEFAGEAGAVGRDDAAAEVEGGALRLGQHGGERVDAVVGDGGRGAATAGFGPGGDVDLLVEDVLGDVDGDGSGPSGFGEGEGEGDDLEQRCGGGDEGVVFGDRDGEPVGSDLLERVGADQGGGDLAGDGDERDGVEPRVGDGGEEVGDAGAGGGEADGGASGDAGHALGDEAAALFMACEDVVDGAVVQRVVEGQDRAAGYAGERVDALAFEQDFQDLGPCVAGCFQGWCLVGAHPAPRRRSPQKSPSGAAPEGQSRVNDQNPRVPNGATTTTTTERAR